MKSRIKIITGDITKQNTDAIVNAANNSLLGGGGVDGSIHRAAGKDLLASCYKNCMKLAVENKLRTIAFPSISTGAYGFPAEPAVDIALKEIIRFLKDDLTIEKVVLVCFSREAYQIYKNRLDDLF